jgi:hypothetical protein
MRIVHYEQVDLANIRAVFTPDGKHRASLKIPFRGRSDGKTLCVIGQNPSEANEKCADKTVRFIEKYIWNRRPEYGAIVVINLYSRVDTNKVESEAVSDESCEAIFRSTVSSCADFLVVFGKLVNAGPYQFLERAAYVREMLSGRCVYKFSIGSSYAPHPGNRKILYSNLKVELCRYHFEDIPA